MRTETLSRMDVCPAWLYKAVLLVALVNILLLSVTRAALDMPVALQYGIVVITLAAATYVVRRRIGRVDQPSYWQSLVVRVCEGTLFLSLAWPSLRLLNHLTMMAPFPYADDLLLRWDQLLSMPWTPYFDFVASSPFWFNLLDLSYTALSSVSYVAMLVLCFLADPRRVRFFIEVFFVTALFCLIVGAAFPAKAAVAILVPDLTGYNIPVYPGVYHLESLEALRSPEGIVVLDLHKLPGLVTFPSFHTAAGILLIVAFWRTVFFLPVLAYSVLMIASTPVFGGHYFVDLIAGTLVAIVICALILRRPVYAGLFASGRKGDARAAAAPDAIA